MLVIPAIDLRQGKCVRLTQGRKEAATVYDGDPAKVAVNFERDGAGMLHVVDLDGAFAESNGRNREILRDVVRAVSIAVESPGLLAKIVRLFGVDHVAVGIDARNGQVVTRGWETEEQISALTLARRVAAAGVERIIYTDIKRDGTLSGVNIDQTCSIAAG